MNASKMLILFTALHVYNIVTIELLSKMLVQLVENTIYMYLFSLV